ncbi:maleylpyruvate isomerase N-terminal domain-containing protein [Luedemannella flava]
MAPAVPCAGWTVRDVAAHLTLQQVRLRTRLACSARWAA